MHEAAKVPLEVAEQAASLKERLRTLASAAPAKFASDVQTAAALVEACFQGALANVRINVASMKDEELSQTIRRRLGKLE